MTKQADRVSLTTGAGPAQVFRLVAHSIHLLLRPYRNNVDCSAAIVKHGQAHLSRPPTLSPFWRQWLHADYQHQE